MKNRMGMGQVGQPRGIADRRAFGNGMGNAAVVCAGLALAIGAMAEAQITVPKYQGPGQLPAPQRHIDLPRPAATTPDATVVEFPIARVNDQIIDNSDYQRALQQLNDEGQQAGASAADLEDRRKNLLRDQIDQQLLLSRGKELDINADAEVIREMDQIRKEHHFDSMEALEQAVRQSGISFEDFKAKIKNDIVTQEVVRDEVGRKLTLTQKDEQAYYDAHKQEFAQPEQVQLSEILVPTPDDATDAQVSQAQAKADDVETKLKAGAKFEDLAKQFSGGPNADAGGDLGKFKRGQLGSALLEDPTFALPVGQWTAPIRTRQGFIILKVTAHDQAGVPPLSVVENQVQQAIYEQAMQPALRTYLTDLRTKAFIDIAPGYTDTGASPNETKPVYASASQPSVKKKVEQKARLERQRATYAAAKAQEKANATKAAAPGTVNVASGKKPKKIHREKIRFGQMPQNSLPETPQETLATGEGPGAPSSGQAAAEDNALAAAAADQNLAANDEPLGPPAPPEKKTRFADRQIEISHVKAEKKATQLKQKTQMVAPALTGEEKTAQSTESSALGLNGDTAAKKKKQKAKGAAKQREQQAAPAPPAPKPEATPIPPKSVRENGEPEVAPPPADLPPPAAPSSGSVQPSTNPQ